MKGEFTTKVDFLSVASTRWGSRCFKGGRRGRATRSQLVFAHDYDSMMRSGIRVGSEPRVGGEVMDKAMAEGIHLFNSRKFFEAHEALEAVWLKARGDKRILLHGLIQVAAALHHHTRQNRAGFHSLLEKGLKKLEKFEAAKNGIDLEGLRRQLRAWRNHLSRPLPVSPSPTPTLPLPRIRVLTEDPDKITASNNAR